MTRSLQIGQANNIMGSSREYGEQKKREELIESYFQAFLQRLETIEKNDKAAIVDATFALQHIRNLCDNIPMTHHQRLDMMENLSRVWDIFYDPIETY